MMISRRQLSLPLLFLSVVGCCHGLVVRLNQQQPSPHPPPHMERSSKTTTTTTSRRTALEWLVQSSSASSLLLLTTTPSSPLPAWADLADNSETVRQQQRLPDSFDIDHYLKTGFVNNPMGVSGQAGKSRPETGVVLREGSEASQDARGSVLAEILLTTPNGQTVPYLATFSSPWPLATGTVFDVECRDGKSGDATFLAVTSRGAAAAAAASDSFFVDQLFARTGRFSFYGEPTDVKIKRAMTRPEDGYRVLDVSFSILSQATMAEIPHLARIVSTVPTGADQGVMLVTSAVASRWKNNQKTVEAVRTAGDSFRAFPAPQSFLKLRGKPRKTYSE